MASSASLCGMGAMELKGALQVVDDEDQVMDEAMKTGGWARHGSKRDLVLDLWRKALTRSLQVGLRKGRTVASARLLVRTGSELTVRLRALCTEPGSPRAASGRQRAGGAFEERPSFARSSDQ